MLSKPPISGNCIKRLEHPLKRIIAELVVNPFTGREKIYYSSINPLTNTATTFYKAKLPDNSIDKLMVRSGFSPCYIGIHNYYLNPERNIRCCKFCGKKE